MDIKKLIVIFFFLCNFCNLAYAQKQISSANKQAQKAYEQANQLIVAKLYDKAIEQLIIAVNFDKQFTAAYQQLGDVYRRLKNFTDAKLYYQKVITLDTEFNALSYFGLAESEFNTGDYSKALQHFKKYQSYPLTEESRKITAKYISDCEFSIEAIKNPVTFKPVNLGKSINSKKPEYLPVLTADEEMLIFTRQENRNEDFYTSKKTGKEWSPAQYLSKNINTELYNEGAQSISPDGLYLFFTGCDRPDGLGRCDIYISKHEGKEWSEPFNIGAPVNTPGWESQPSLSADGRTLYFVSTRKGGFGGYDIWKSELGTEGSWSVPVNLGPNVNTSFDEQSPFIHPDDQTLYFSSNGWPGLGNKDIFISRKDSSGNWKKPQNLGFPINTYQEESGLTISNDGKTAFFASDKKGGFGGLDIYSFELPQKLQPNLVTYVKGIIFDKETKNLLDAKVQIINLTTGKSVFDHITDTETGEFLATMTAGQTFGLNVSKTGYLFYSRNFSLETKLNNKPFKIEVPLQKIEVNGMVVLNNIFFETNQFNLLPASKIELQQLINFLNENPATSIEIGGHTDNTGDDKLNKTLSENRAKTVYNFLISNAIPAIRLSYKGYGKSMPITDNSTEEGRKNNRRTEFKITKN